MKWYRDLYTGKRSSKKKEQIINQIEQEDYSGGAYLITLAVNSANQLELLPVKELRFPYHRDHCPLIIGIASGKKEAMTLLTQIVQDVYDKTGGVDIRRFFTEKQE